MPPRKKATLPDHVRAAVLDDIALTHEAAMDALERDKIRIYLATEQGLDTYEIADRLGLSQTSVSKYAGQGRRALAEREQRARESAGNFGGSVDPDRPGELLAHS